MPREPRLAPPEAFAASLDAIEAAIPEAAADPGRSVLRARAIALYDACGPGDGAGAVARLDFAARLLALVCVDLAADPGRARRVLATLQRTAGVPAVALARALLSGDGLSGLPAAMSIDFRLALLAAFTQARAVTLWSVPPGEAPRLIARAGADADDATVRDAAQALAHTGGPARAGYPGVRLEPLGHPPAVLLAVAAGTPAVEAELLLAAAGPSVTAALGGGGIALADGDAGPGALQRRLARLRFDLHDGPQQDVHLLGQDLALFASQLETVIDGHPDAGRLRGRVHDLEAQLVALDGDLRRLSSSVQSPFVTRGSLPEALTELTQRFADRTGVTPAVSITGTPAALTDSQQITLLALVGEALANIRKHARAREVRIVIETQPGLIRTEVSDDGAGFDPERALVSAARAGHLGLVGMHERVRMLGGRTRIDSRPGGPTVISATLPAGPQE